MKRIFLKSLALVMMLCASLSAGAVDWAPIAWVGDGAQGGALNNTYKISLPEGVNVVNIQRSNFAAEDGFYITFPDAALGEVRIDNKTAKYARDGASISLYISNFTAEETEVQVMNADNSAARYTIYVYYKHSTASAAGPTVAPADPTYDASQVKAVYSSHYGADCDFGEWESGTTYAQDTYGKKYTVGNGYFGITFEGTKALDCTTMEKLHLDVWTEESTTIRIVPIHNGCNGQTGKTVNLAGGQWNSFDIALNEFANGDDWSNVYQIKIDQVKAQTILWVNNIYFYVSASTTKTLVATVSPAGAGVASIKQDGKEVTEAEKGTEVVFSATENDGYAFSGWYNGATLVSTDKDYTLVVEKSTTLEARFRQLGNIYCHTPLTSGDNTIYLTMKQEGDNYKVVIDCEKEMAGFSNAYIGGINGNEQIKLNDADIIEKYVTLSADKHRLTVQVASTTPIKWNSPIYINMPTEVTFAQPQDQNIEYSMPCADVEVESVSMPKTAELIKGRTITLVPTVEPLFATDKALIWESDDEGVATVADGIVTGVAEGEAVITATSKADPTKYAICTITVTPTILPDWVELTHDDHIIQYLAIHYTGTETYVLTIKGISSNVTGMGGAFWYVNGAGKRIDDGKEQVDAASIRMQVESNPAPQMYTPFYVMMPGEINFGQFTINWIEKAAPETPATGVTLSESTYEMSVNETHQLTAKVLPAIATNKAVGWSSDNETVAGVDENGLVTAKAAGVAHITATTADGGFTASCTITVVAAIEPMTFYGRGSHSGVDIIYSITRNTERHLVYTIHVKTEKEVSVQVNDDDYRTATKENENYIYTSEAAYSDGETVKGFFYMVFAGGAARVDFTYTVGAENAPIIYTATDASTLKEHTGVVLAEGAILTISADKALGDIYVENGAVLNAEATLTADNLYLSSQMGGGKSGQVRGAEKVTVKGDVYFDITFGDNANPEKWHAFTVPFQVDALSGIYDTDNSKLTNEVNYAIMDYHGDVRATGKYGWKKYRGMLQPGTFYIMTVDGNRKTFRLKKAAGAALNNTSGMAVHQYAASGEGENGKDNGWNGIGNPSLVYGTIGVDVQVLNPATYTYELKEANTTNFTVGTPFFYQAAADGTETLLATDAGKPNYAPARESLSDKIYVGLSDGGYEDRVVLSASEDATTGYETGRDLVKLTMTDRPAVPQIFAQGYGLNLCKMDAPLANNTATYPVMLYAPEAGEYTLSARSGAEATVYLTKEGAVIWNLSATDYIVELDKGNNEGYGILLKANAPQTPTDIDNIYGGVETEKVLFEGNLYILHGGHTYDATGKMIQ